MKKSYGWQVHRPKPIHNNNIFNITRFVFYFVSLLLSFSLYCGLTGDVTEWDVW